MNPLIEQLKYLMIVYKSHDFTNIKFKYYFLDSERMKDFCKIINF